jgi:hypothetical protein
MRRVRSAAAVARQFFRRASGSDKFDHLSPELWRILYNVVLTVLGLTTIQIIMVIGAK